VAWVLLLVAGLLEVAWAFFMKQSAGFTRLWPSLATVATMIASFGLLAVSMRTLPLGVAYPVWTGVGALGAVAVGVAALGEPLTVARAVAALMIAGGLALMTASGGH
jgi:quaternary ammonium compound-resistance protein SugE